MQPTPWRWRNVMYAQHYYHLHNNCRRCCCVYVVVVVASWRCFCVLFWLSVLWKADDIYYPSSAQLQTHDPLNIPWISNRKVKYSYIGGYGCHGDISVALTKCRCDGVILTYLPARFPPRTPSRLQLGLLLFRQKILQINQTELGTVQVPIFWRPF